MCIFIKSNSRWIAAIISCFVFLHCSTLLPRKQKLFEIFLMVDHYGLTQRVAQVKWYFETALHNSRLAKMRMKWLNFKIT